MAFKITERADRLAGMGLMITGASVGMHHSMEQFPDPSSYTICLFPIIIGGAIYVGSYLAELGETYLKNNEEKTSGRNNSSSLDDQVE